MKKLFLAGLIFALSAGVCFAGNQWREGGTELSIAGTESPSDIDEVSYENVVAPLHRLLANYREGAEIVYASASTLTVEDGEVVLSNATGTIRLMQQNTSDTTVSWSDLDTGSEAASTTYYLYAYQATVADTDFDIAISLSSSTPTGITYYKRLGSFYNDAGSNITDITNDVFPEMGDWTSKSVDVAYQATTDGDVLSYSTASSGGNTTTGYTDSSNPPTTIRAKNSTYNTGDYSFINMPVKKGDYYKVTVGGTGLTSVAYWIPDNE